MNSIVDDTKMSDAEGLMWRLEKDPHLSSTFGNVSFLDRAPDFEVFRRRMERAALVIPRLRQVVRPAPGNLTAPTWVDDSEFDIDSHLRRYTLPSPADERALLDLASAIVAEPFDRRRPLWQFTLVEGLVDGRAALIQKMHHTLTDGERGVEMSLEFLDFERDAAPPPMPDPDIVDRATERSHTRDDDAVEAMREVMAATMRFPLGVARHVRDLLADPAQIPSAGVAAADTLRAMAAQLGDVDGARSPLWTERSLRRRIEISSAPLGPTKAAARTLGGTLNTAFMSIAAHAVSRYHRELGAPVDELRASMAISTRTADSGANAFSLVRLLVPTAEMTIDDRFRTIHAAVDHAIEAARSASLDSLAGLTSMLPTSVVTRLARQQAQTIDFATSNVKGSPVPVYLAGAKLLSNHAIGPLAGVAFNLTLLSYDGRLDMGLNTDRAAVTEPEMLRRFIGDAVDELVTLAD